MIAHLVHGVQLCAEGLGALSSAIKRPRRTARSSGSFTSAAPPQMQAYSAYLQMGCATATTRLMGESGAAAARCIKPKVTAESTPPLRFTTQPDKPHLRM